MISETGGMEKSIFIRFFGQEADRIRQLSGGHINSTLLAEKDGERYILQRLKGELFRERLKILEKDYLLYREACGSLKESIGNWALPEWVLSQEGGYFTMDEEGGIWRAYGFIPGESYSADSGGSILRAFGAGLAKMHFILSTLRDGAEDVLPGFHDLQGYLSEYRAAIGRALAGRDPQLEEDIESFAAAHVQTKLPGRRLIHGDTRIANALFWKGHMIAMLDLDSFMYGSRILDIADGLRSCCLTDQGIDNERVRCLLDGYQNAGFTPLSVEEMELLPYALARICFELGLRYYTDHLSGNKYFTQEQAGQNLEKARKYIRSVSFACCRAHIMI